MTIPAAGKVISTILRHDRKQNSYKLALVRAIGEVALAFPDLAPGAGEVAIPVRLLAERWVAYYWPFVAPGRPIWQGSRPQRVGGQATDMSFRPALTALRAAWEQAGGLARPADGFYLVGEMRVARRRRGYPPALVAAYDAARRAVQEAIQMPIQHAGPGNWQLFARPQPAPDLAPDVVAVPGTQPRDKCLTLSGELWQSFQGLSLWVEALCLHEWCLFTERIPQEVVGLGERGAIYSLLTDQTTAAR